MCNSCYTGKNAKGGGCRIWISVYVCMEDVDGVQAFQPFARFYPGYELHTMVLLVLLISV